MNKVFFDGLFKNVNISAYDVLENTIDGIAVTDSKGIILYLNRFAGIITGWEQKETIGKEFEEVFRLYEGKTGNRAVNPVKKAVETQSIVGLAKDTLLLTKNNEYIYLSASISTIRDFDESVKAVVCVLRDVSRLRKREIDVEENERKYRALFNNTSDAILVTLLTAENKPGNIIEVNETACQMFGYSREELLCMKINDLSQEFAIEFDDSSTDEIIRQMESLGEAKTTRKCEGYLSGNRVYFEITTQYFVLNNQYVALAIIHDVTGFRVAQEQILQAKKIAEEASKTKSMFLANMSHEIRTPLNGIIGMSDLLLKVKMSPEEQRETTKTIISCSQNLLHLLNNILDFSKIEAEKVEVVNRVFDLKEMAEESVNMYRIRAKEKNLVIRTDFKDELENWWIGDKIKIQQILNNLINNAVKFTLSGEIIVSVNKQNDDGIGSELQFTVSDTGIGIDEKDLKKLFVAFSQVDGSYTRQFGGTGLGLSIAKRLVELMGGRIWVESTHGIGSRFNFVLRLTKSNSLKDAAIKKQRDLFHKKKVGLKGKKVLLVEDERINQQLFMKIADFCMFDVDNANNGIEAVNAVKLNSYDLILMDIQMPVMDGIEATKQIREFQKTSGTYVAIIAVTAHALEGDREKYLSLGMDDYLAKPYSVEELIDIISRNINLKFVVLFFVLCRRFNT
ncbi:MAG: Autoinducer 2 sensor kinase/phosphatase LuxQ [Firmicutes bacterium ADurb.Bin419]|nr:MAG: Autoinducer 2 sensor kinase/phosphatase LuxQ [Firmicutes bacterium ADurb.Bin419]